jgi:hypothetical protein
MNTNQLKKFAQSARVKLIEQVGAKLNYVLTHDTAELRGKANTVKKLKEAVDKNGKQQVIEKVSYTWFNRLVALRFMDANGYQPIGMSVLTPANAANSVSPELLDAAHSGSIPTELTVDRQHILDLLDGRVSSNNPDNEVFRILLVSVCNQLHTIFPFLFEKIDDYTELLLPDDLTSSFSIVKEIVDGMPNEDCAEVEIIGWLYQFYISEKKDEVFASKSAVKKEDIPAATQLFTPRWIVEYMVQNTVGKLWLQNKPNSKLKDYMPYFIDSPSVHADDYLKVNSVEEVKLLDQACGSGHILVYGFDLFFKIYEEEGYNPNEIPSLILKNNLFGFEIDERAAQLAGFALLMKARSYYRRFFRNPIAPNILCYQDLQLTSEEIKEAFAQLGYKLSDELNHDLHTMLQATNFGSLIAPHSSLNELQKVKSLIRTKTNSGDAFLQYRLEQIETAINQLIPLCEKYHCIVANPPYMGGGKMNKELSEFVKLNYSDAKADLLTCFVERGLLQLYPQGFSGFVTMESWMFLSSFEKFRKSILENTTIHSLTHFGWHVMRIAFGTVAFVLENTKSRADFIGTYSYLEFEDLEKDLEKPFVFPLKTKRFNTVNQKDFEKIPGSPIGYWISANAFNTFAHPKIGEKLYPRLGMATADNHKFLRFVWEISLSNSNVNASSRKEAFSSEKKWFPYAKGGDYRKWFGNNEYMVNWAKDGFDIMNFKDENGKVRSHNYNLDYIFNQGITWNALTSSFTSFRILKNSLFDNAGSSLFIPNDVNIYYVISLLNSNVTRFLLPVINPTLNFQPGTIGSIPLLLTNNFTEDKTINCINISKEEYDFKELSLEFKKSPLTAHKNLTLIEESFDLFKQFWTKKFFELHKLELEINNEIIGLYNLNDDINSDVPLSEISILKEETIIENGELVFHADEVFAQFVSYAVGCMFGRYSLDKEGLILANQGETLKEYLIKVAKNKEELSFIPDEDNVIPVLDDEWFEDDIVARFHSFLKASFGEKEFQKNLAFVEECIGKDIRKYFVKDFYKDHIKRYKKRPIYWMFSSPKGYFNVLIYMHRYTQDTLNAILNGYLREFIGKLELQRKQHEHTVVNGSPAEQNRAQREIDKIDDMLADCRKYESEILYPLAGERISIDLDDGVLVNYNKFGAAIAPVDGLNDKKTKKKVMEFDWIDTTQIR